MPMQTGQVCVLGGARTACCSGRTAWSRVCKLHVDFQADDGVVRQLVAHGNSGFLRVPVGLLLDSDAAARSSRSSSNGGACSCRPIGSPPR